MTELESDAMEAEFGTVAGWTEEAVRALGPEYAVPAGCRGTGSEAALRWLADRLDVSAGTRMLDSGAGVGGPAGWLAAERGVQTVCAEPMTAAVRASRRVFGLPSVVAPGQQLPFVAGAFDAAWCLGVLCTTSDKAGALGERQLLAHCHDRRQREQPPARPDGGDHRLGAHRPQPVLGGQPAGRAADAGSGVQEAGRGP